MEFRGIRQTSRIGGVNRNPGITEHEKVLVWDNDLNYIKYLPYLSGEFNTKTAHGIVHRGNDSPAGNYIWKLDVNKNPSWRKEDFLVSALRQAEGNTLILTMNDSTTKTVPLGPLAWLDSVENTITLPGDQKVLFDDNNTIGGDISFKYNKTTKTLDFTGFTGIQAKNGIDATLKSVLQYLGRKNTLIGHGITRNLSWGANMEGNLLAGEQAGGSLSTGSWNTLLGNYAGQSISSNVSGMVAIGAYAGKLESESNKFYVGNVNYASQELARLGSLLYGDFSTGWLRVNNRLDVGQEVKIGTFDTDNTPSGGMVQFVDAGGVVKPQYYDNDNWVDFATGANNYLSAVTKATADVGTTSDAFKVTFVRNGLSDLVLQLGANAFNSTIIPHASDDGLMGMIQISSGATGDANRGFTAQAGLQWVSAQAELKVPGGINLAQRPRYATSDHVVVYDSGHYYGRIGSTWVQLDNSPTSGQANALRYDGSITAFDLSLPKVGSDLPIKGIKPDDARVVIVDNLLDNDLDFSLQLAVDGLNEAVVSTTASYAEVFRVTDTPEGVAPVLRFRPLISTDGSVQFVSTANDEIDVTATGTGGGESNAASNVGVGIGWYKDKTGTVLRFKSILEGDHIGLETLDEEIKVNVQDIVLDDLDTGVYLIEQDSEDSFTFTQKPLIDGIATEVALTDGTSVKINVTKAIPAIGWTPTPSWTAGGTLGQGALALKANYSADIRTSATLAATTIMNLNVGAGLFYDFATNTLKSVSSGGSSTDYQLTAITKTDNTLHFAVTDEYGEGIDMNVDYTFGALAFLDTIDIPIATYTDNEARHVGGVMVNKSPITTALSTDNSLYLDEELGELKFNVTPILYTPQYDLLDSDNTSGDNVKRGIARSNIGAAYINGDIDQNFSANDIESNTLLVNDTAAIQHVEISGNHVTSDAETSSVVLSKRTSDEVSPSWVEVKAGEVNVYANKMQGSGNVNFYSIGDAGTPTRIAFLDSAGNLHLKLQLIARDTTV